MSPKCREDIDTELRVYQAKYYYGSVNLEQTFIKFIFADWWREGSKRKKDSNLNFFQAAKCLCGSKKRACSAFYRTLFTSKNITK